MDWMILIFTVLIGLIILDHALFGLIPFIFRFYPSFRSLLKEGILIEDDTCNLDRSWRGDRYKSLILTKNHLIIRNSYFTSIKNIDVKSINSYAIKKKRAQSNKVKFIFNFTLNNESQQFSFITQKAENWIKALSELGVESSASTGM